VSSGSMRINENSIYIQLNQSHQAVWYTAPSPPTLLSSRWASPGSSPRSRWPWAPPTSSGCWRRCRTWRRRRGAAPGAGGGALPRVCFVLQQAGAWCGGGVCGPGASAFCRGHAPSSGRCTARSSRVRYCSLDMLFRITPPRFLTCPN